MDAITSLFESFDLAALIPQTDEILETITKFSKIVVLIGPILLLVLGLTYLFLSPREANHRFGFRTWFGMGSVAAWRYTQRLAGIVWGALGLILTIVMLILRGRLAQLEPLEMLYTTITYLLWQAGAALLSYIAICLIVTLSFDRKGNRRRM